MSNLKRHPEITDEDRNRIKNKWNEIRNNMHNVYSGIDHSALLLAEYVTIYERSADQQQNFICVNCKLVTSSLPKKCSECYGQTFEKTLADVTKGQPDELYWKKRWETQCEAVDIAQASVTSLHLELSKAQARIRELEEQREKMLDLLVRVSGLEMYNNQTKDLVMRHLHEFLDTNKNLL